MTIGFPGVPSYENNHENLFRKMINVMAGIMQGRTNNTGTFTLTANSGTTTITFADGRLGDETGIWWTPTTANAAAQIYTAPGLYESARSVANRTLTLTHTNNAQTDRTYKYELVG